jgi:hypothetical protein
MFLSLAISSPNLTIGPLLQTYSLSGWFETMLPPHLPELTENEQQLNKFTPRFTVLSSDRVYLAGIVGAAALGYSATNLL